MDTFTSLPVAHCVSRPLGAQGRGRGRLRLRPSRSHQPRRGQAAGELASDSSPGRGRMRTESPAQREGLLGVCPAATGRQELTVRLDMISVSSAALTVHPDKDSGTQRGARSRPRGQAPPRPPCTHLLTHLAGADGRPGALLGTGLTETSSPQAPRSGGSVSSIHPTAETRPQSTRSRTHCSGGLRELQHEGETGYTAARGGFREFAGESQEDRLL